MVPVLCKLLSPFIAPSDFQYYAAFLQLLIHACLSRTPQEKVWLLLEEKRIPYKIEKINMR